MDSGHVNGPYGRPLYRSRNDRMIAGVCGGLAERYGWDPTLVRLAAVAGALVSGGGIFIAYIVAAIVIPEAPEPGFAAPDQWYSAPWNPPANEPSAPAESAPAAPPSAAAPPAAPPAEEVAPGPSPAPTPPTPTPQQPQSSAAHQWASARPSAYPPRIPRRSRNGGLVVGAFLVLLGLLLLFGRIFSITLAMLWPLILVAIGLVIIFGARGGDWR